MAVCLLTKPSFATPIVHAGDRVAVKVYNHPELSQTLTVDSRGYLAMPLAGSVAAAGLAPTDLAAKIKTGLTPYMRYPAVEVNVAGEGSSVFVSGGPVGKIAYQPGQTLVAGLSQIKADTSSFKAGDQIDIMHSRIDLSRVGIDRDGRSLGTFDVGALNSRGDAGPQLAAGDTIVLVNKPVPVRVDGDIAYPGTTFLDRTEPLSDAFVQLGGLTPTAANAQVSLTRDGSTQLFGMGDPVFKQPAHDGDVVVVPTAPRVTIAGMVGTPGPVVLKNNFTLLSALYSAGGPNKFANLKIVQVVHNSQRSQYDITKLTHGDITQNPELSDGDVVFVPEGHRIDFQMLSSALFSALYTAHTVFP